MNQRSTYGQRLVVLYVAIVLATIALYQRGVRPLIIKAKASADIARSLADGESDGSDILQLERRLNELDRMLGDTIRDADRVQHDLLTRIARACRQHHTDLVALAPKERRSTGEHILATESITLRGGFHDLLRTVDELERSPSSPARIVSLDLQAHDQSFGQERRLHATLCFQSVLRTH